MQVTVKFSEKDIKILLKSLIVICDTREQQNKHILNYFTKKKIPYKVEKLDVGDYSFMLPKDSKLGIIKDIYFNNKIVIERKMNLDELANNFTRGRNRLESELLRAKDTNILLMIENAKYSDIISHKYRSKLSEKAFLGTLKAFESRYNLDVHLIDDDTHSGNFIYYTFYYRLREFLKS